MILTDRTVRVDLGGIFSMSAAEKKFFLYDVRKRKMLTVQDRAVIGRTQGLLKFPKDEELSRRHCEIYDDVDNAYIEDFYSANKTRVNGVEVEPGRRKMLRENDVIEAGGQCLVFSRTGRVSRVSLPRSSGRRRRSEGGKKKSFALVWLLTAVTVCALFLIR